MFYNVKYWEICKKWRNLFYDNLFEVTLLSNAHTPLVNDTEQQEMWIFDLIWLCCSFSRNIFVCSPKFLWCSSLHFLKVKRKPMQMYLIC